LQNVIFDFQTIDKFWSFLGILTVYFYLSENKLFLFILETVPCSANQLFNSCSSAAVRGRYPPPTYWY